MCRILVVATCILRQATHIVITKLDHVEPVFLNIDLSVCLQELSSLNYGWISVLIVLLDRTKDV